MMDKRTVREFITDGRFDEIDEPVPLTTMEARVNDGSGESRMLIRSNNGLIDDVRRHYKSKDMGFAVRFPENVLVLPGGVDIHVHGRDVYDVFPGEPGDQTHKEDSFTLSLALAHGGATAAVCQPNLARMINDKESWQRQMRWINSEQAHRPASIIPLEMYNIITPGSAPWSREQIYKMLWNTFGTAETNFESDDQVASTLRNYSGHRVTAHLETIADMVNDPTRPHYEQRPACAANNALDLVLTTMREMRAANIEPFFLNIAHISTSQQVEMLKDARKEGLPVTAEITPQVLWLSYENFADSTLFDPKFGQQNPPLPVTESERFKLRVAVANGDIDYFATDHAPHTIDEKEKGMSGMPQADTAGLAYLQLVSEGLIGMNDFIRMRSTKPGRFLWHTGRCVGMIAHGYESSFALVSPRVTQLSNSSVMTKCAWTPFQDWNWNNTIEGVVVKGTLYTSRTLEKMRDDYRA